MLHGMLILSQLAALAPLGTCGCPQPAQPAVVRAESCRCCKKADCETKPRRAPADQSSDRPCRNPNCAASPSFARISPSGDKAPAITPPAAHGVGEPSAAAARRFNPRQQDAILLPTAHLFLIYGVLVI
jgi:hypothetical protein